MKNHRIKLGKDLEVGDIVWFSPYMGGTVREINHPDGTDNKIKVIMIDGWGYGRSGDVYDNELSPIRPGKEYYL